MSPGALRHAAMAALFAWALPSGASDEAPPSLEGLMAGMASARGVVAEFHETKEIALLRAPIESRGVLHFVPPDRLVRRVVDPAPSELESGDVLRPPTRRGSGGRQ